MTQREFDLLPGLLTRRQFLAVTGLSLHKLREAIGAGIVGRQRTTPNGYCKYFKRDAARLSGFVLN